MQFVKQKKHYRFIALVLLLVHKQLHLTAGSFFCPCFVCSGLPPAGHLDVVCLLVSEGAEISCKDKRGYTPLHAAASSGQIAVVKHLLNLAVEVRTHVCLSILVKTIEIIPK